MNCETCRYKHDRSTNNPCLFCSACSHYERFPELFDFERQKQLNEELAIIIKDLKYELYSRRQKTSISHPKMLSRHKKRL